uniref:PDZ domain-containing protein n=2 Tax=Pseudo-nitzschia australis TaxID=44445 RepID=A0A7S4ABM1_9STRA|mmetsp:Transcript_14551/g.29779  ORF Transcript_14551/g.29779 Transcript_14551/m.29779 type:complete len:516 (-) Transcript_14551:174-1721(-)|eukprot:CAMPEP_0168169148 /NCGR_PEP_ID=MMETSP0139_2-20121125/3486_1 /TAXON_ID=44445 /ORGANISM="Pseudo-nitzschia australis, Strain 10249 10 AB" /LENGTH=515 /DNA_ID=CAMNT_0008086553 /DNA_START=120 /DNA_END=1667 /DNA_ORIENTATION=-
MAEDLTKTLTVQRNIKKKSGYSVSEKDSVYYLETAPTKARINPGDRIVGINGISSDDFVDEEGANDLIEGIRFVLVPKDKLDEYDDIIERGGVEEEAKNRSLAKEGSAGAKSPIIYHCDHCGHDNEDLSVDEDGDFVCEECGHVVDPPPSEDDTIHVCSHCNEENRNLEPDEEGDLVCQNCGYVIPVENNADGPDAIGVTCKHCNHVNHNLEPDEDGDLVCEECGHVIERPNSDETQNLEKNTYVCLDCEHENVNPELDEEGNHICEECGGILPEKTIYTCEVCKHENINPQPNEDGDYLCEHCGSALDVDEEYRMSAAGGCLFDENGMPITNKKTRSPADMFEPGDVITVNVGKSNALQDSGLKIDEQNGKYYIRKVPSGGLFAKTPVIPGDKILELNGINSHDFKHLNELKKILKEEKDITIVVLRRDPDASDSSASSVDYDELRALKPMPNVAKGVNDDGDADEDDADKDEDDADKDAEDEDAETEETEEDLTAPYHGEEDCGCVWCPDCHE